MVHIIVVFVGGPWEKTHCRRGKGELLFHGFERRILPHRKRLGHPCDLRRKDHRFIETVAHNRGIPVKDFDSERQAVKWLMNQPNKSIDSDKD